MRIIALAVLTVSLAVSGQAVAASAPKAKAAKSSKTSKAAAAKVKLSAKERAEHEAIWRMRAALNVAALQCQYDPLLALPARYNTFLRYHVDELAQVHSTLVRVHGGHAAFDKYNTRVYNAFSTVDRQVPFCNMAADLSVEAMNAPPFGLTAVATAAQSRLAEFYTDK